MRLRKRKHRSRAAASSKKFRLVMSSIEPSRGPPHFGDVGSGTSRSPPLCEPSPVCSSRSRRLLDDGPVVITGVAGLLEQLDPTLRIVVEFRGQHPLLEQFLLF